jgi:hypothetical protein
VRLDIDQAQVSIDAPDLTAERAERLARLLFDHLLSRLRLDGRPAAPRRLPEVRLPALEMDWADLDDDAIARLAAADLHRRLSRPE